MTRLGLPYEPTPPENLRAGQFTYWRYLSAVWNLFKDMLNDIQYADNTNEKQKESAMEIINLMYWAEKNRFGPASDGPPAANTTSGGVENEGKS